MNLVLHHLDSDHVNFPNVTKTFNNLHKVLKPGGILCINHLTQHNLRANWFCNVLPSLNTKHFARYPSSEFLKTALQNAGGEGQGGFSGYTEIAE